MHNELLDDFPEDYNNRKKTQVIIKFYRTANLQVIVAFVAFIAAMIEITSILITGPIGSIIGFTAFYWAIKLKYKNAAYFGLSIILLSLSCFLYIYTYNISTYKAASVVPFILFFYFIILIIWFFRLKKNLKK